MPVKVEFYGLLRELAGRHEWSAYIEPGTTVAGLYSAAKLAFPALGSYPQQPIFTSGLDYVEETHIVRDGETISALPPPPTA